jgi:iron complex transport system substrate-binding protein
MRRIYYLSALALILALSACGAATPAAPASSPAAAGAPTPAAPAAASVATRPATQTITDVAGRTVTLAGTPQRIVSLAPSDTEVLYALDLAPRLLAVDDLSDYPVAAKTLPKIGGSGGKYNTEQIVALKPDLVMAAGITAPEVVKQLEDLKLPVVVIGGPHTTFENILSDITLVGQITGQVDKAALLTSQMRERFDALRAKVSAAKTTPRVYWELDGTDAAKPFTVGPGNFVNDLIGLAGGTNIFASASSSYPQVGLEQVVAADPEVIILADAAYGISVDSVMKRPGWGAVAAVKQGKVYPIDPDVVSRPGPRIVDGLEATVRLIHPELFQ